MPAIIAGIGISLYTVSLGDELISENETTQLSGLQKASLLLIALGSKTAGSVLQQLSPDEVRSLCEEIAKQKNVDGDVQEQVLQEFARAQGAGSGDGGVEYARELLQAVGANADELLADFSDETSGRSFGWLKGMNTAQLAACLQAERPQVTALVLAHLQPSFAADVISALPEEVQGKVAYRLTTMQPVAPEAVKAVEENLRIKLSRDGASDLKAVGGIRSLVTILNNADRPTEKQVLDFLEQAEASIAESVRQMLFVFEDIIKLDDQALQTVIRELDQQDLRLSMKGAPEEIQEAFFKNMSERAAEALKEDLEVMGPVRLREVEAARGRVVAVVRRLNETGQINISSDKEDMVA